jgi:hypothetical protein
MMCKGPYGFAALCAGNSRFAEEESRKLEFLLYGLARLLRRRFDSKARGLRLSRSQSEVLLYISDGTKISVRPVWLGFSK